ncbi:hypothetical protein ILUMI_09979 [Ignelater luminosus]|uniref:Uncharacterized protein n=1 Tax=Ignelater luminosus TaxID=2038154 RepID=A0A8K0D443_IGNLU|nr:hypothetical protein ILUMI_09979 [Ignelater luminosus]
MYEEITKKLNITENKTEDINKNVNQTMEKNKKQEDNEVDGNQQTWEIEEDTQNKSKRTVSKRSPKENENDQQRYDKKHNNNPNKHRLEYKQQNNNDQMQRLPYNDLSINKEALSRKQAPGKEYGQNSPYSKRKISTFLKIGKRNNKSPNEISKDLLEETKPEHNVKGETVIVMGDFNGKIGQRERGEKHIRGPYSYE